MYGERPARKGARSATDPFNLERFVAAQAPVFSAVLAELRSGRKRSHWMWFVFPQFRGLGHSHMAQLYGIGSLQEGRAYLAHAVLGPRLVRCTQSVLALDRSLNEIFGAPDDRKFCSSMSLFSLADEDADGVFAQALRRHCEARIDPATVELANMTDAAPS